MDSYRNVTKLLKKEGKTLETSQEEVVDHGTQSDSESDLLSSPQLISAIKDFNQRYEDTAVVVENAVRVEQGEYAVLPRKSDYTAIGTHHVIPCIIICATSDNYYGMAHFDSFRMPDSLGVFINGFNGEIPKEITILGGKEGMDYLRTGSENYSEVLSWLTKYKLELLTQDTVIEEGKLYVEIKDGALKYCVITPSAEIVVDTIAMDELKSKLTEIETVEPLLPLLPQILKITSARGHTQLTDIARTATIEKITPPLTGHLDCVLHNNGTVDSKQCAGGIGVDREIGAEMRLFHNIGGIVIAVQSRVQEFLCLNLNEACSDLAKPFLLDRLALNALQKYIPSPDEKRGGEFALDAEMSLAFTMITEVVNNHKKGIDARLTEYLNDEELRRELIAICPMYVGDKEADLLNEEIMEFLIGLCEKHQDDPRSIISDALAFFNEASQYPLMKDIIGIIADEYKIKETLLHQELHVRFGENLGNKAYGVDVLSKDLVSIITKLKEEENPGLHLIQTLKLNREESTVLNTSQLVSMLCDVYGMDFTDTMEDICAHFNRQLEHPDNQSLISTTMESKDDTSRKNVIQAMQTVYSGVKYKLLERKFKAIWEDASTPTAAISQLLDVISDRDNTALLKHYLQLYKVTIASSFAPVKVEQVKDMSFNRNIEGIKGAYGRILNQSIVECMQKNSKFQDDFSQGDITSVTLTKKVRDQIPYKSDENLLNNMLSSCDLSESQQFNTV